MGLMHAVRATHILPSRSGYTEEAKTWSIALREAHFHSISILEPILQTWDRPKNLLPTTRYTILELFEQSAVQFPASWKHVKYLSIRYAFLFDACVQFTDILH